MFRPAAAGFDMQSTGTIRLEPNPIVLTEMNDSLCGPPAGTARISRCAEGVREVEVRAEPPRLLKIHPWTGSSDWPEEEAKAEGK
jgi:hypothetical protein